MRIVVDTNVLLTSIGRRSYTRWLFDLILNGQATLLITNEILTEYREIIAQRANQVVADNVTETLTNLSSVEKIDVYFHWRLITLDPDDNKFVDCAISGNADYIITYDNHFNVLANVDFPKVNVITPDKLQESYLSRLTISRTTSTSSLQSFTGQAFQVPQTARPVVILSDEYQLLMPQTAWQFTKNTPTLPAANLVQGAYMSYGQGRVVVLGEAAMFTAQREGKGKFGMNSLSASQNAQFLLNTIHWLDNVIK